MKEFLISFKDKGFDLTVRVNGKDEKDATAAFKQLFPKG